MRKLKEVLRLRYELKLGYQQIGRSCAIGVSTVHKYLKRAEAAGLNWPLPADWDEARVEALVFPRREPSLAQHNPAGHNPARTRPDFAAIHEQLRSHKYVTLQLLWEEYRQANADGYRYSRFCELYQRWRSKLDVVLRQEHKAGEKMFVDWAGATIPVHDRHTGIAWQAPLFVAGETVERIRLFFVELADYAANHILEYCGACASEDVQARLVRARANRKQTRSMIPFPAGRSTAQIQEMLGAGRSRGQWLHNGEHECESETASPQTQSAGTCVMRPFRGERIGTYPSLPPCQHE
jgi:hypothetical protein